MSLQKYKILENNKGGFIPKDELEIYEKYPIKTSFGIWPTDTIRVIIYDASKNILPQSNFGNVRYINQIDFNRYFKSEPGTTQSNTKNYKVDVKKLIKEAGYNIGIFTVELMFVNNRVGTEQKPNRLWIYEISPSRTEVRVIPFDYGDQKWDNRLLKDVVNERYNALMYDREFKEDIYELVDPFLSKINYNEVKTLFINRVGNTFFKQIVNQYFSNNEDNFFTTFVKIINDFKNAVRYSFDNKNSIIGSQQFGLKLNDRSSIDINFKGVVYDKLKESLEYYIPKISLNPNPNLKLDSLTKPAPKPVSTRKF